MSLPILQSSTHETTHVRGDVTVDSSAMIAMGVILNATPGNKIVIHGGVCLGMGTVITAYDGDIEIKANAILGAGCLVFGHCVIGHQASLGASVTIYNINVDTGDVIPAGSIRGDRTRQIEGNSSEDSDLENKSTSQAESDVNSSQGEDNQQEIVEPPEGKKNQEKVTSKVNNSQKEDSMDKREKKTSPEEELKADVWQEESRPNSDQVVGKVYINKLLFTLFPERNM